MSEEELFSSLDDISGSLGAFYLIWAAFEHTVELSIAYLANLDYGHANLLLHGVSFTRKASILKSLLTSIDQNHPAISIVSTISNESKRNLFAHSFITQSEGMIVFNKRDSKNKYKHKHHPFNGEKTVSYTHLTLPTILRV